MADLNLQVRLRALDEMSRTFRNIGAASNRLMRAFDSNRNTLRQLNDQLRNVEAYRRQQESMRQTADNIERMRNRMQRLQQQMGGLRHGSQRWRELASQFDRASRDLARLENVQNREQQRLLQLTQRLRAAGINTRELAREEDRLRNSANRTNTELERQAQRLQRIAERHQRNERRLQTAANASMAGYVGINTAQRAGQIIASPVREYMQQEQASTDLKVTMMRADGSLGAFEEINKQAIQLGNVLPGTTQDFINLARSLKEKGVRDEIMTGGGLKTAAELSVLMNMGQYEGGEFAARLIEAHGLNPDDIGKAADMTQRAYFAFGLKKEDMAESMKYYAPTVNSLGITGEENYKKLLAIQGMAARQGLEGSMFGTNFSAMLGRLAIGPEMIRQAKKGMKAEAKHIMRGAGVDFNFYDQKGKFKGPEAMIAELEKLNIIQKKFGEQNALLVAKELFGSEAGRPAMMLAQQGIKGFNAAMADMAQQADANARIAEKTSTLSAAFEQLGGVAGMLSGMIGENLRESLLWFAQTAQKFLEETLQPWLKNHKTLVKWAMIGITAFAGLAAVGGVLLLAFAGFNASLVATSKLFSALRGGFVWLAQLFMSNPILLAVAAIGAAIWLIYQNWDAIVGWTTDRMEALANWWKNFSFTGAIKSAFAGIGQFFADIGRIIWDSIKETAHNVREAFREMGVLGAVQAAFEGVFNFFATLGGYLASLVIEAGKTIVTAIFGWDVYNALVSTFSKGIEWVVGKIQWMVEKINGGIQAMKDFLGLGEKIGNNPAQKISQSIDAYNNLKKNGVFEAIKKTNAKATEPAAPVAARNNLSSNSNTTVNINVSGGGDNKALAAQIGKEVRGALANERRRQGGSNRSAFYDTDAALA